MNSLRRCFVIMSTLTVAGMASSLARADLPQRIDLAGSWSLRLDPQDQGIADRWFVQSLPHKVNLPGSIQFQGYGDSPRLDSEWTGTIRPEVIQMPRYAPYRDPANFKMPFWLQPKHYYVGPAWFQRQINISRNWAGQHITLRLERCHWFTQVWVDDRLVGRGDSLSTPHDFDLTGQLTPGSHRLSIRVDNRVLVNVGQNAHSVTDHTQTNWNGIIGNIELRAGPVVAVTSLQVYPNIDSNTVQVQVRVANYSGTASSVQLCLTAFQDGEPLAVASRAIYLEQPSTQHTVTLSLTEDVKRWNEFAPHLCTLEASLHQDVTTSAALDRQGVTFGMREITTKGRQFLINGRPTFFRGTLECCIFPLTGFPPTDLDSWRRIIRRCKEFGLNHIRFHSWCPPEAAFAAADELGFYFQVECASWANGGASVGDGKPLDQWLYDEADRILEAYGNHPSFVLFAYGNEPSGPGPRHQGEEYLSKWVHHYRQIATRQQVTSASGWPYVPENQFHVMHHPLRQHGSFNRQAPSTSTDYREYVNQYDIPLISHETGQWCVFPNLDEMGQYTGVLEAKNFEIVRDFLKSHHLLHQAHQFLTASGALQTLLYKEEIEVMLRTPDLGGFQLLDLHDFPGQGTALIGVLNPFWEPKPYITATQFHRFCGPVVPLARLDRRTWTNNQTLTAKVEIFQYGSDDLQDRTVEWTLRTDSHQTIAEGRWSHVDLPRDGLRAVGNVKCPLTGVTQASRLKLTVGIVDTPYRNDWDVWVYPATDPTTPNPDILVATSLDTNVRQRLDAGGKVLFLPPLTTIKGNTYGSFETIFWNRLWFPTQQVHTLGVLCDPAHPAFQIFPTDAHTNWQWWDLCRNSKPIVLDDLPTALQPLVQVIDDWNTCRKLGLVFEAKVGTGKLLVCGIDLERELATRPVARQLRASLLQYMASDQFAPTNAVTIASLKNVLREPSMLQRLRATISADSQQAGYEASQAMDHNPNTIWHTAWGQNASGHPHQLVVDLQSEQAIGGLTYVPRQDMSNGRIAKYAIFASHNGKDWAKPLATGVWPNSSALQTVRWDVPVRARYMKLVSESEVRGQPFASAAEVDVLLGNGNFSR